MPGDEAAIEAGTGFGFDLYAWLSEQEGGENLFVSPLSVYIAMAMTYNGADGETRAAMSEAMRLQGLDEDAVNRAYANLMDRMADIDPDVELDISNSLWAKEGFEFAWEFMDRNRGYYDAEIANLDFNDPETLETINGWVNVATNGKIESILDEIGQDDVLYLINAIYFNGAWTTEFDEELTEDMPFHLADGSEIQHPMMRRGGTYTYLDGEGFQLVRLPYGENGRTAMYVLLPDEGESVNEIVEALDAETWAGWTDSLKSNPGTVSLPRFTMEYEVELNDALKALGMGAAFDPNMADFGRMTETQVFISKVKHKAVVEVNEAGTEAAAVTSVGVTVTSAQIEPEPFEFTADRPFFFVIQDDETEVPLFMGTLQNPAE
jgi:serpin B